MSSLRRKHDSMTPEVREMTATSAEAVKPPLAPWETRSEPAAPPPLIAPQRARPVRRARELCACGILSTREAPTRDYLAKTSRLTRAGDSFVLLMGWLARFPSSGSCSPRTSLCAGLG